MASAVATPAYRTGRLGLTFCFHGNYFSVAPVPWRPAKEAGTQGGTVDSSVFMAAIKTAENYQSA